MAGLVSLEQAKTQLRVPDTTTDRDVEIQDLVERASASVLRRCTTSLVVAGWSNGTVPVPGDLQTATLQLIAQLDEHRGDDLPPVAEGDWKRYMTAFRDPPLA
jgi:Phage gp6-like head-tail connector protein